MIAVRVLEKKNLPSEYPSSNVSRKGAIEKGYLGATGINDADISSNSIKQKLIVAQTVKNISLLWNQNVYYRRKTRTAYLSYFYHSIT